MIWPADSHIMKLEGKFYFWDESLTWYYGPFDYKENAERMLSEYAKYLSNDITGSAYTWKHNLPVASEVKWRSF